MTQFWLFIILGLGAGGAYAIVGLGIVTIHKGSGIINFAQGAFAMVAAYTFKWWSESVKLPLMVGVVVIVLVAGIGGWALYVVIFRAIASTPDLAKVVVTIALFGGLQGLVPEIFNTNVTPLNLPSLVPTRSVRFFGEGSFRIGVFWTLGISLLVGTLLWSVFRFTRYGLATRAAAENARGAAFLGYSPTTVGAANWAIGCALAAIGGVLLLPVVGASVSTLSLVVLPALAAALIGRFSSFGITIAAGVLVGVGQSLLVLYWNQPGVGDALPFIVIVLALLMPGRTAIVRSGILSHRPPFSPPGRIRIVWLVVLPVGTALAIALLSPTHLAAFTVSMIMSIIALSVVVVTGFLGQISLAQTMLAGIGAFVASKLATGLGLGFPLPILLAVVIVVPVGLLVGIPALRVRGLDLAIVTLGAAIAFNSVVFQNLAWTGGVTGSRFPSPELGSLSLDPFFHPQRFATLIAVVLGAVTLCLLNLRRSDSGRRMLAIRGNERAASAVGIDVTRVKLLGFALSAGLAALGGALLGYDTGSATYQQYSAVESIELLSLVFIFGIASVGGGLLAGTAVTGGITYVLLLSIGSWVDNWWLVISAVALIVTVLGQPDGVVPAYYHLFRRFAPRRRGLGVPEVDMFDGEASAGSPNLSASATAKGDAPKGQ